MTLIGASLIAKAWADPVVFARLQADATYDAKLAGGQYTGVYWQLVAVADTSDVFHVIACVPCSCYPLDLLGDVPDWYKDPDYRAAVGSDDPRDFLQTKFGLTVPASTAIRVWWSSAERRYIKIPQRPSGTNGWSQTQLAALLTPPMMIGTALAPPQGSG